MYIDNRLRPNLAAGFHIHLQYLSVFHCCINTGVFIKYERWKAILSVKLKFLNPA